MVALVRKSPARDPGRFSSSVMRWVMRACSLMEKNNVEVGSSFNNSSDDRDDPDLPVLPLLQYLHRVKAAGFLDGCNAVLLGVVRHHGRWLHGLTRRLGLWWHHRGGSRGNRRRGGRRSSSGLRRNQLLWCVGGGCCVNHGALREAMQRRKHQGLVFLPCYITVLSLCCFKQELGHNINNVDHIASTTIPTTLTSTTTVPLTKAPRVPSGQDLGGPFWFCPCIPTGVPEGPGGGMVGPIMPKLTSTSTDT